MTSSPSFGVRAGLFGVGLVGLYVYLRFIANGGCGFFVIPPGQPAFFTYLDAREWRFLMLHALVLVPSVMAIAYAVVTPLTRSIEARLSAYERYDHRQMQIMALLFTAILFALYRILRAVCLRDLAITDDENAIEFGARLLTSGQFTVAALEPADSFLDLFLYTRDGRVTSMDWPGAVLFRAASRASGLADHLYALTAAVGGTAVVATAHRLFGRRLGMLAAVVFLFSPLAVGVNLTAHAQLVSRAFIAIAVWAYVAAVTDSQRGPKATTMLGFALGAAAGCAFLTRPFESAALLTPAALHVSILAARGRPELRPLVASSLAIFAAALGVFAWYNSNVTGDPFLPPRFDHAHINANFLPPASLDYRIAGHVQHNVLMLGSYFLGVLGLPFAVVGAIATRGPVRVLAAGLVLSLMLMLGHDNLGIHTVGPIHYSESVVPLTLLFVAGADRIGSWFLGKRAVRSLIFVYAALTVGGLFTLPWLRHLAGHGEFVAAPHEYLESQGVHHAIVISPPLAAMHTVVETGSWQLQMPHADPLMEEDIVFALPTADPDALHEKYPDRLIYRFVFQSGRGIAGLEHIHSPDDP